MATAVKNFTINRGLVNDFIFTIKQNKTFLPVVITITDTFRLQLINQDTNIIEYEIDNTNLSNPNGHIEIFNAANGQIKVIMNPIMTSTLEKEVGPKEDRYYNKPSYRLVIEGNTVNNGHMVSKIKNVYID
mgnify:FL=1